MKLRILKSAKVSELRNDISKNLRLYRSGNFSYLLSDASCYFECDIDINESCFVDLAPDNSNDSETKNCKIMLKALTKLTPYVARDERLWVYLTHSFLLCYARERWIIPDDDDKAIKFIGAHFFAKDKRGIERDNAASRLWWQATLCNRVRGLSLDDSLNCLLYDTDVRANIIERPTTAQCLNVFTAIVKKLHKSYISDKSIYNRGMFRALMKKLNLYGGFKLLNAMDESEIMRFIDHEIG